MGLPLSSYVTGTPDPALHFRHPLIRLRLLIIRHVGWLVALPLFFDFKPIETLSLDRSWWWFLSLDVLYTLPNLKHAPFDDSRAREIPVTRQHAVIEFITWVSLVIFC